MGTQPENIERALQGKRTLPKPGEQPEPNQAGEGEGPEVREGQGSAGGAIERKGYPKDKDEEQRFQARGGRFNAASEERA